MLVIIGRNTVSDKIYLNVIRTLYSVILTEESKLCTVSKTVLLETQPVLTQKQNICNSILWTKKRLKDILSVVLY